MTRVAASIVTYNSDRDELVKCIGSLQDAGVMAITIVDNSPENSLATFCHEHNVHYIFNGKNLGYGAAHNIAIRQSISCRAKYHLVINSDVYFGPDVIDKIVSHMDSNQDIGQLIPRVTYPDGRLQHVVRLLPTPLDVIGRRFLPVSWTRKRNDRYTLAFWDHASELNIPYHQGSFMFLRVKALEQTGLFDERFFMYPEDIDLTRRIHRRWRTVYWPGVSIVHAHRAASYKSGRMLRIHMVNMVSYFNKWGWIFDSERRRLNRQTLQTLKFK